MVSTQTLKNAARAIDHDLWTDISGANYLVKDGAILRRWEPAVYSQDAFELMVALEIEVGYWPGFEEVHAESHCGQLSMIDYTMDRAADTRWAIVICASKVGESL